MSIYICNSSKLFISIKYNLKTSEILTNAGGNATIREKEHIISKEGNRKIRDLQMNFNDTIAAVSTPRGKGGVAMIRISGEEAIAVAAKIFRPKNKLPLTEIPPRRASYGDIFSHEPGGGSRLIDDGIAVIYHAPASFTGESSVELTCHGGVLITQLVLESALCAGARLAEPGEFTRRAYLAGRLTLEEAEALGLLLDARTHSQLLLSRSGMEGRLGSRVSELYKELRGILGNVYAAIDFPDEDLSALSRAALESSVAALLSDIRALAATYRTGRSLAEGVSTVICGRTNSGKSSLYNRLAGYDAAIVTDIEGTTRDLLESIIDFGGITLRICDTAGLRESGDAVEKIGVERARHAIDSAELILALIDGSRAPDAADAEFADYISGLNAPVIALVNKIDLPESYRHPLLNNQNLAGILRVSALTGEGLGDLSGLINKLFTDESLDLSRDPIAANARQFAALNRAAELTSLSLAALRAGLPEDAACSDLEGAMSALAEIDGREVSGEIVSEIFSRFCVGK